jgi:hypothetical protein
LSLNANIFTVHKWYTEIKKLKEAEEANKAQVGGDLPDGADNNN